MTRTTRHVTLLVVTVAVALLALTAGVSNSRASTSCGIVVAAGHPWIIVSKVVPCSKAKAVTRPFAARTNALHTGGRAVVHTALLPGFTCVPASQGKSGGSCSTAGAGKSVLWLRGN
jgi:hypothetical protein